MTEKKLRFSLDAPLNEGDTELQTYGCRAKNPEICRNCYVEGVCAFTTSDNICRAPSSKWKSYYNKLKEASK